MANGIPEAIHVRINDQPREIAAGTTLAELVRNLDLNPRQIAIERNLEIVSPSLFASTVLQAGDSLEIVTLVGGG